MTDEKTGPDIEDDEDGPLFPEDGNMEDRMDELEGQMGSLKSVVQKFQSETSTQLSQILRVVLTTKNMQNGQTEEQDEENLRAGWMVTTDLLTTAKEQAMERLGEQESLNKQLQSSIQDLQKETVQLQEELANIEKERDRWKHEKELLDQEIENKNEKSSGEGAEKIKKKEFPSNETIIHNLLTSQVEFYFSDHHLKRDKPLMEKLCSTEEGEQGFIPFEEVTNFPKVRTLGQDAEVIERAVRASQYLVVKKGKKNELLVGRSQFSPPAPQQFPFRRTVFVYGIKPDKDEEWVRTQFECFGNITKIKFDSGSHSCPRKVGARLLRKEQSRVIRLHIRDSKHTEFIFKKGNGVEMTTYICGQCERMKKFTEGYYMSTDANIPVHMPYMFCIQCAAKKAEENLKFYQQRSQVHFKDPSLCKDLFGIDQKVYKETDNDLQSFTTCLIVFESQRQASKCVYVRSRLGIEGCFATHFHNFTRHKREICAPEGAMPLMPHEMQKEQSFSLQPVSMKPQRSTPHAPQRSRGYGRPQNRSSGLRPPPMRRNQSAPTAGRFRRERN